VFTTGATPTATMVPSLSPELVGIFMASTTSCCWPASQGVAGGDRDSHDLAGDDRLDLEWAAVDARRAAARGPLPEGGDPLALHLDLEPEPVDEDLTALGAAVPGRGRPDDDPRPGPGLVEQVAIAAEPRQRDSVSTRRRWGLCAGLPARSVAREQATTPGPDADGRLVIRSGSGAGVTMRTGSSARRDVVARRTRTSMGRSGRSWAGRDGTVRGTGGSRIPRSSPGSHGPSVGAGGGRGRVQRAHRSTLATGRCAARAGLARRGGAGGGRATSTLCVAVRDRGQRDGEQPARSDGMGTLAVPVSSPTRRQRARGKRRWRRRTGGRVGRLDAPTSVFVDRTREPAMAASRSSPWTISLRSGCSTPRANGRAIDRGVRRDTRASRHQRGRCVPASGEGPGGISPDPHRWRGCGRRARSPAATTSGDRLRPPRCALLPHDVSRA